MHRSHRRRLLRSALAFVLVACAVAVVAQLAGVSERATRSPRVLAFDDSHDSWLVRAPGPRASARIGVATERLGGGRTGPEVAGDWYEVRLGDEVPAADAETAFGKAGATDVEPVVPRVPYDEPVASDDPSTTQPSAVDDPVAGVRPPTALRNGPVSAPRLGSQWALTQPSDQDIDAPEAWQVGTGSGAVVAVIDTGVDASHPDLAGRVLPGRDFSGSSTGATVDRVGHGTAVASIVAGNGTQMAGVAPDSRILPLKVFRDSAAGFSMSGYLQAIRYAADQGADVINISLGCGGSTSCYSQAEFEALQYAASKGVVIVTAAGNGDSTGRGLDNDDPDTPDFPSTYEVPGLLSVTSSTRFGDWSTWSNYGRTTVDLAAPGEGIVVAAPGGSFRSVSGTSFSAPMASGTVAILAAAYPEAGVEDLRSRVVGSTVRSATLVGRTGTGGVLNANGALFALGSAAGGGPTIVTEPTSTSPRGGASVGTPPVLAWTLPTGWSSVRVQVTGPGATVSMPVAGDARSVSHPTSAWRSGTYRWTVVARAPDGSERPSAPRTYRLLPRLGAWVSSGTIRSGGRSVRLRVGYAASEPAATVRIRVLRGRTVLHDGRTTTRTMHTRGAGSPRRGWFTYTARLSRSLRRGEHLVVEVRVSAGGRTLVRSFRATVR